MISIKSKAEIELMRESNRIVAEVLEQLEKMIKPGISTWKLNKKAEEIIVENSAESGFKGYSTDGLTPYKFSICASINDEIVHGYSSKEKILRDGDIISIDVGVIKNNFYGDGARTFAVGTISEENRNLLRITELALIKAIEQCIINNRIGDISAVIEKTAKENGFYVADGLTGHGIGRELHELPIVYNFGKKGTGPRLFEGMTIAIEPMFNIGTSKVREKEWVFYTADNSCSAHFENTVLIQKDGPEILTKRGVT
ncbi:MAG: type I methionyl aminopeptidase [Candidatus Cloacimonetes bacterium]|nr:type I methionyl aminopeptidase [Candidatus Cloacimonadota bacterium]MBL7085536.1 type I methionyl aminopeptidase [Candidatus Cloacimonadota bacterium]